MQTTLSANSALCKPAAGAPNRKLQCRQAVLACRAVRPDRVTFDRRALLLASAASAVSIVAAARAEAEEDELQGFKEAPSGIYWKDVLEGSGPSPVKGANIRCHYNGRLTNGRTFDSSYERRKPLTFKIGVRQVIAGWDEGILGDGKDMPPMKEGGKRQLVIPPHLGYGERGAGGVIPPNAILLFDIELLGRK